MHRYYVEYYPEPNSKEALSIYLYAYSPEQIKTIMDEYKIVLIDQTD